MHFDLIAAGNDRQAEADRLLALGASRIDHGRHQADSLTFADPDGNEFCLLTQP